MIAPDWQKYENSPDVNPKVDWPKASEMFDELSAANMQPPDDHPVQSVTPTATEIDAVTSW